MGRAGLVGLVVLAFWVASASSQYYSKPLYKIYRKPANKTKPVPKVVKKPYIPVATPQTTGTPQKSPFRLDCQVTKAGVKSQVVNCKVYSTVNYAFCVHLQCKPTPKGPCQSGSQAQDCSWNVVNGCSSPTPLYPGGAWSFGFMTSKPGPISIAPPALGTMASDAINGTACPR